MQLQSLRLPKLALVAGLAALAFSGWALADPPSRVARLGAMTGAVSFSPAGESDWMQATVNRPLTTGDRLWSDAGARAEIQVGGAMIRLSAGTGVSMLNLDDQITQLQLSQGTLNVRVRRLDPNQVFEVDTPNLAFTLRQPGEYRIDVDPDGSATTIVVRKGQGEVYGEGASYVVDSRQPYRFAGTGLQDYSMVDAPRLDEFDRWSADRDRSYDTSASARYVSQDVVGYQDLDANGTWRVDAGYGNVWVPNRVAAGWAPYHDGHWAWVDPWGWTWVDDAPWGFAVSHYGRWANLDGTWGWVPGPRQTRAYYAPALVAFVGGSNFQIAISGGNVGGVAWFPLGPRDVYRPSYAVSRGYFENVNRSNTVINTTVINNYYNNTNVTNVVYANRQVPGAVVAVPTTAFAQSQSVSRAAVRVTPAMVASAPVAAIAAVAPTERSVRGAAVPGEKAPPGRVFERPVVARAAPPAAPAGFAAQQQQLAAKPGKPLDDAARRELKPAMAGPAPVVKVVTPTQVALPTARPPPTAPGAKPIDVRGKPDDQKAPPAISTTPVAAAPAQAPPPASVARPSEQRGKPEQPVASPPPHGVPVTAALPPPVPPRATPQAPEQRGSPEQRGQPEQRRSPEQRGQPAGSPPPQHAAPVTAALPPPASQPVAPAKMTPPPPTMQPPSQAAVPAPTVRPPSPPPPPPPQAAVPAPAARPPSPPPPPQVAVPAPTVRPASPPPPPQMALPAPVARPPPKPEVPIAAKPVEARPPAVASKPALEAAPKVEPRGQDPKPAVGKPDDKKKDGEQQKRDEEERKQKG